MGATSIKATEIFELQTKIETLEAEMAALKEYVKKADRAVTAFQDMGAIFGNYLGTDNRLVPAVITHAFPQAGTVDIVVFDNLYSGGKHEITGVSLGNQRGEFRPYLVLDDVEEETDASLLAAQPG